MANADQPKNDPTASHRQAIDWQNPAYYDRDALHAEFERVFDVCHGCRRCLSLCESFPTLFDLIDDSETMEVDGVNPADFQNVVDECYLCDMCYVAKCPYVPPHPLAIDFPHLMLQAKAISHREQGMGLRDQVLSDTDRLGQLAGIPIITETVNAVSQWKPVRQATEKLLGVHADAWLPEFAPKTLRQMMKASRVFSVRDGERTPGKVAIFATCYINYNEPSIGQDLIRILEHNAIPWVVAEKEVCCGMPKLEQGDLEAVDRLKRINIPHLAKLAREGYAIMAAVPSCTLMFKQELPLMYPDDIDVKAVQQAFWDPFDYFVQRIDDALLSTEFKEGLGQVSYQAPCHSRVQHIGKPTEAILKRIPNTDVKSTERCSGHAGTYGVKAEFHETAMKIGKPVFRAMHAQEPDFISTDCPLGGHHIAQGIRENHGSEPTLAHPLSLLAKAYGLNSKGE